MQCGVGRYFMPAAHLLTDTEKSSVPYKTPLKNHRERKILGVFVKLGVRTLIPISHILAISPTLEHRQVAPAQARQQLKPHATARHVRHDPQVWTPQNLRHGNLKPGLRLRPCAAPPEPTQPLRNGKSPVVCGAGYGGLKPCAQKWQTAAAAARAARANATFRPRVAP